MDLHPEKLVEIGNFSETWISLGLSGTIRGSIGTIENPLGPFGTVKAIGQNPFHPKIRGRLSDNFETILLLEHLTVLINSGSPS